MGKEKDYLGLLEILINVIEANKGVAAIGDDRILDAEGLALKVFSHSLSAYYIYQGINISGLSIPIANFYNPTSLNVLGRAAFETYLIFNYVFVTPKSNDEKDFKFYSWEISGLLERQKFPFQSPRGKEKLEEERKYINELKTKLQKNSVFQSLTPKQQKNILKYGYWRLPSWREIALSAGLSELHAQAYYSYLCGYAHSGNLSITQLRQASNEQRRELMESTIGLILIALANTIKEYLEVFPKSKEFYLKNIPKDNLVDLWIEVGSKADEEIDINWEDEGL